MLKVGEIEEAFFDTSEQFTYAPEAFDYDIWLKEPVSVRERRESFLSRFGMIPTSVESGLDDLLLERRNSNSEANCSSVDHSDEDWLDDARGELERDVNETKQVEDCVRGNSASVNNKKKNQVIRWLKSFSKENHSMDEPKLGKTSRIRMKRKQNKYIECSAVYCEQQVKAHNGLIWTMRFSPDGQFLASGGEDGVVCIWRVTMVGPDNHNYEMSKSNHAPIIIPDKIFHLEEEPVQKFKGHSSDVLDLAWSTSNHLLSTSTDKIARLWHVDSEKCLGAFHHSNYVTCVQFNPVDERYFITGSIDGKVRVWGIPSGRVEEWADVGDDIVTAVCYQSNGKGFVVGTLSGNCRFYESSGDELLLNAEINMKKKSSANKITGIQFLNNETRRLMITSEGSKICILDGLEVVRKYKGLTKSGSQMCASFTSSGRHIVSLGEEDSCIYIWNYDDMCIQTPPKQLKSIRSCETFISQGASVVLPWLDSNSGHNEHTCISPPRNLSSRKRDSERFSLGNWFSMDKATWPEEKLPLWDSPSPEYDSRDDDARASTTWGLVFVTANCDGTIRTFRNYGLPVRV